MSTPTPQDDVAPTPVASPGPLPDALLQHAMADVRPESTPTQLIEKLFDLRRELADALLERSFGENREENIAAEDAFRDALPPLDVPPGPFTPMASPWRAALPAVRSPGFVRWSRRLALGALGAAILRDFLQGNPAPAQLLDVLGDLLRHGLALGLFSNVYAALGLAALFWLGCRRSVRLDVREYRLRLELAARIWWGGAARCADILLRRTRSDDELRRLRQVGQDLYSFAGEMPPARRAWLEDRLRRLGLEAPRLDGALRWSPELAQSYEPLGYLEPGDCCYADTPPLLENGRLLRKGTVRKVRSS